MVHSDDPQSNQQYALPVGQDLHLCVETRGEPSQPAVVWVADPLSLHTRHSWDRQFASALPGAYFLVRYDGRGLGDSSKPEQAEAYTLQAQAGDLHEVINAFVGGRFVVVAAGWGGAVLAEYLRCRTVGAQTAPSGVVLLGAVTQMASAWKALAYPDSEVWANMLAARNEGVRRTTVEGYLNSGCRPGLMPEAQLRQMIEGALTLPPAAIRALFAAYRPYTERDEVQEGLPIAVPALICHGEDDQRALPLCANLAQALFPLSRVHLYPRLGHCLAWDEEPARDIYTFLESVLA